jgi:hypothetical protein
VSAHGLRKATARRLPEIGCSANQIASITGHASLSEVQRYTKAADRKRMAREAMKKLMEGGGEQNFVQHVAAQITGRSCVYLTPQLKREGLCGQNSAGFPEIRAIFQRDNLRRPF